MTKRLASTVILAVLPAVSVFADVYKWIDDKGNTHYGDRPPQEASVEPVAIDSVNVDIDQSKAVEDTLKVLRPGRRVTDWFVHSKFDTVIPFETFDFRHDLKGDHRFFDMVELDGALWLAAANGFYKYEYATGDWSLFDKSQGLPGDRVNAISTDGERLLMDILKDPYQSVLHSAGSYWYIPSGDRYQKTPMTVENFRAGGEYTSKNSDVLSPSFAAVARLKNRVLISSAGAYINGIYKEGGIAILDPLTKRGKQYTTKQGIGHEKSYGISVTRNDTIWLSHWQQEHGLSYLPDNATRWKTIKQSKNGVALGGITLASFDQYLLIGSNGSLVVLDSESLLAIEIDRFMGLPGFIVNKIYVAEDSFYVSAYTYKRGGRGTDYRGLAKFLKSDIAAYFKDNIETATLQ